MSCTRPKFFKTKKTLLTLLFAIDLRLLYFQRLKNILILIFVTSDKTSGIGDFYPARDFLLLLNYLLALKGGPAGF
jgi:hypothetical protein